MTDLSVPERLHRLGIPLLEVRAGRKAITRLGWADPHYDPEWSTVRNHILQGGNVGVRSGPAPRMDPAIGTGTVWIDDDIGHVPGPERTPEMVERSARIRRFAEAHAFIGIETPTGGFRYGFVSSTLYESDGQAVQVGGYAVELYSIGPEGGCRNSVIPPSRLYERLEPPKPGRMYVRPDYALLWFRDPAPGELDKNQEEFAALFDRLQPWRAQTGGRIAKTRIGSPAPSVQVDTAIAALPAYAAVAFRDGIRQPGGSVDRSLTEWTIVRALKAAGITAEVALGVVLRSPHTKTPSDRRGAAYFRDQVWDRLQSPAPTPTRSRNQINLEAQLRSAGGVGTWAEHALRKLGPAPPDGCAFPRDAVAEAIYGLREDRLYPVPGFVPLRDRRPAVDGKPCGVLVNAIPAADPAIWRVDPKSFIWTLAQRLFEAAPWLSRASPKFIYTLERPRVVPIDQAAGEPIGRALALASHRELSKDAAEDLHRIPGGFDGFTTYYSSPRSDVVVVLTDVPRERFRRKTQLPWTEATVDGIRTRPIRPAAGPDDARRFLTEACSSILRFFPKPATAHWWARIAAVFNETGKHFIRSWGRARAERTVPPAGLGKTAPCPGADHHADQGGHAAFPILGRGRFVRLVTGIGLDAAVAQLRSQTLRDLHARALVVAPAIPVPGPPKR